MRKVSSLRRLCLTLLLAQVLAIQALVVAWSGAQAMPTTGAFVQICKGAQSDGKTGDAPNSQHSPHDCLSACTGGLSAVEPNQPEPVALARVVSCSSDILRDPGLHVAFTTQVFSARAPPALVVRF
jgi:hypothetical protein